MSWLVTGGAGYIGSHVVRALTGSGRSAVVLDDLSSGHRDFVAPEVPFVQGTIVSARDVESAFDLARRSDATGVVHGVIHLAGFKYAGVSVQQPLHTFEQNVTGMQVLLAGQLKAGVKNFVFSSSAATYGTPDVDLVTEATPTRPESPYGQSKLAGEWLLHDLGISDALRHTSLRYFNVVGSGFPDLYDTSPHNLFPLVLDALAAGRTPRINGTDYPTPDGTTIRDYVHVDDLAAAHVLALHYLEQGGDSTIVNLGTGRGASTLEVIEGTKRVSGVDFATATAPRRPGDPTEVYADNRRARELLDWEPKHDLDDILASAWTWHSTHPDGYGPRP
jgi:UDP-glucose 4-epimerase